MTDDLSGLVALVAVAEQKSFTAAAAQLRVSPSAMSQTIKALEERLGARLVQRTTRSVGLTEAGASFVTKLKPALQGVRAALDSLDTQRGRPVGTLRLNVPRVACRLLEPMLASFLAKHPDLRLDLTVDDGLADIVAQGFDAGIRLGATVERDMIAIPITHEESAAVVASPAYFAERRAPKHPRDLHAHDCINYRLVAHASLYRWEFIEKSKELSIAVDGRLTVNDADTMIRAALDGVGVAYLLESLVREHVAGKRLVRVLEPFCPPFTGFFLYYPNRADDSPKLQALVSFFRERTPRRRARS